MVLLWIELRKLESQGLDKVSKLFYDFVENYEWIFPANVFFSPHSYDRITVWFFY